MAIKIFLLRMMMLMMLFRSQVLVLRNTTEGERSPECMAPGTVDRFHITIIIKGLKRNKSGKNLNL